MRRRVVVTGLGVVTSLGETVDQMWENVCAGKSGIVALKRWDASTYPVKIGGECLSFDLKRYAGPAARHMRGDDDRFPQTKRLDRFAQFGVAASVSAVNDSGIDFRNEDLTQCGVIIGTGIGGIETIEEQNKVLVTRGVS